MPRVDMLTHRLGGFVRSAGDQYFRKRLMPPGRSLIRGRTRDAKPGRCQSVCLLDRKTQSRAARAFGDSPMQFFVSGQVQRLYRKSTSHPPARRTPLIRRDLRMSHRCRTAWPPALPKLPEQRSGRGHPRARVYGLVFPPAAGFPADLQIPVAAAPRRREGNSCRVRPRFSGGK